MPRRRISMDVALNTASMNKEADRLKNVFQSRLRNIQVGTQPGRGGAGGGGAGGAGGGRGGLASGMPGSSLQNLVFGGAQFAFAGFWYKFFSDLPSNIAELDRMATANRRATQSFTTLAGGAREANAMIDAYIQGTGNVADRTTATTEAMRLFNIGMADNAQQMRAFTTLSRGMSQALGRPVDYIQEQFSLALANQSLLRFDQLGLSIERHQEIMAQVQEQYPELTREMAFQNAMIIQATERYYGLAQAQEALATSSEIATREIKNAHAALADWFSMKVSGPIASMLAYGLGARDFNLNNPVLRNFADARRTRAENMEGDPGIMDYAVGGLVYGQSNDKIRAERTRVREQLNAEAGMADALIAAQSAVQAAYNAGIPISEEWSGTLVRANDMLGIAGDETNLWTEILVALVMQVDAAMNPTQLLGSELLNMGDAAEIAAQQVEATADRLIGATVGMAGKLIAAGASPEQALSMLPSQEQLEVAARDLQESAALSGDAISDEIALAQAERELLAEGEAWIDAARESEAASKRASNELEQAARKAEDAFLDAADSIVDAYDEMLQKIPGVFGTSEVTKEDLRLAELGLPVNYADDALRRLEDVAFNKTERGDVDLGAWAQALRLPGDTDPEALAIFARRAWESGELWSNPENIEKFMNLNAAQGDLMGQEFAALGQQNLRAFFGLGTEEGDEFLRVFGVEALDPIQDGLITEITTRGPIMGSTLAEHMHEGFRSAALRLPWVQGIMDAVNSQVGRKLLEEMNTNAQSDMANAEAIP